jgi:putative Ig domain-containing protein
VPVDLTTPFAISGASSFDFAVGTPAASTVSAGGSTTAPVTFQPTTLGGKLATLTIAAINGETHQLLLGGLATCPAITVAATLPDVDAGVMYAQTIGATGGISPYVFTVTSGSLPPGLFLSSTGVLSGTTTAAGTFSFTIQAIEHSGTEDSGCFGTATFSLTVRRSLAAVGPTRVWIGLTNSDDDGLRVDLRAEVLVNGVVAAAGELANVKAGNSGFNNALLQSVAMSLSSGPVDLPANAELALRVAARRTCASGGHNSGTIREWYNGQPLDSGASRDAGSRIALTFAGSASDYFMRNGLVLATTAGTARQSVDVLVNGTAACPTRPFTPFGTWTLNVP